MKTLLQKIVLLTALFLLLPCMAMAQESGTITGRVIDATTNDPLPGANIVIPSLNIGTASDVNGEYTIENVPVGTHTLEASFIGYETAGVEVTLSDGEILTQNFSLQPDFAGLEEIVVTGIAGQTQRAEAAIDVATIDAAELTDINTYSSLSELLAGKVAGVRINQTSGNIGGGYRFDIRGGGSLGGGQPVIYIDGIRVENAEITGFGVGGQGVATLANISPENIADIQILKGPAAAALYGTSGANGVVLITTKTGINVNEPLSVRYKGTFGTNRQIDEYTFATSGTPEKANEFFRPGGIQSHSISASGGAGIVNYYGNISFDSEEGAVPGNKLERLSYRANFNAVPVSNLFFTAKAFYSTADIFRPQNDNNIYGILGNTLLARFPFVFADSTAVVGIENVQRNNQFLGAVDLQWDPFSFLTLNGSAGYELTDVRNGETIRADLPIPTVDDGSRSIFDRRNEQFTYDINARADYSIMDDLRATTTVGFQAFDRSLRSFFISKQDFSTRLITNVGAGGTFISGDEGFLHSRNLGVFAYQDFNYDDLLFVNLGVRRDYASVIGLEAPNTYYPQARAALRLDQFNFIPESINLLKPRIAYGASGDLPGLLAGQALLYEATPSAYGAGATLDVIGNPEIEPERVREIVLGLDAGFWDRLNLGFSYYRQRATGGIVSFENAPSTGRIASDVPFNIGEKKAQGVEVTLGYTPFRTLSNTLTFNIAYAYQTNEVLDLGGAQPIFSAFDNQVIKEDLPEFAWFTYRSVAEFNEDGEFIGAVCAVMDENGDCEREFLGKTSPTHSGSFSLNFRFLDDFNLYALADFATGVKVLNANRGFQVLFSADKERNIAAYRIGLPFLGGDFSYDDEEALEDANVPYLSEFEFGELEPGTEAYREVANTYAGLAFSASGVRTAGNYLSDADFLKLREISLSYDISDLINNLASFGGSYVDRASLVLSARNILTISPYSGIDPEVNFAGARSGTRNYDFLTLAPPQTYTLTVLLKF